MEDCELSCDFLQLPDEIWTRILKYVDPEDLLALTDASTRFASITCDRSVVGTVRFRADTISEGTLGSFLRAPRVAAISEVDLTNCVLPPSITVEQGLGRCVNLTALRCVNCRLSSRALFSLVLTRLPKLQLLHWSLLGCRDGRDEMGPALMVLDGNNNRRMSGLRSMYVELVESSVHVHTLCRLLPRLPRLRDLHVHVLGASSCEGCSPGVPLAYGDRPLPELERFTYTTDAARGRCPYASRSAFIESRELWHLLLGNDELLVQAFRGYATLCNNVALRLRPRKSRSCVHLSELLPAPGEQSPAEGMAQMCVTVDEPDQLSAAAARSERWSSLDALTLLSPLPLNRPTFPPGVGARFEAPLKALFAACSALTELNLSRFHFTPDLSCCALVASMRNLRALSLPACALAEPNSLEDLARGQIKLHELDIRGSATTAHSVCAVCSDPRTCGAGSLVPLSRLGPLRRLTLCGLSNVHSVMFLQGCRVGELRLAHLGRRGLCCYAQGLGAVLAAQAGGLRVLKLEHAALTLSSHMLHDQLTKPSLCKLCSMLNHDAVKTRERSVKCLAKLAFRPLLSTYPEAPSLELLCLTSSAQLRPVEQDQLINTVLPRLPRLRALHVHAPGVRPVPRRLPGQPRMHFDGSNGDNANPSIVFTNELSILCRASNFIGLAKPHNRDPQQVEAVVG